MTIRMTIYVGKYIFIYHVYLYLFINFTIDLYDIYSKKIKLIITSNLLSCVSHRKESGLYIVMIK
jgi:hypothetical protein